VIARRDLLAYQAGNPAQEGFVLRLEDSSGGIGLGEARTIDGYGSGQQALVDFFSDFTRIDALLQGLENAFPQLAQGSAALSAPIEARFAAETALCDLASRGAKLNLSDYLGYPGRTAVSNSLLVTGEDQARRLAAGGNNNFKLKARGASTDWLALFDALLQATDGKARIRIDANGSWDLDIARARLGQLPPANVDYLEQPFPVGDLDSCLRLKDQLGLAIGIDEGVKDQQDVEEIARRGAADVIVIKPMFRGLFGSLALARRASSLGLDICFTHSMDGTIGRLATLHLAAALGGHRPQGLYAPGLPRLATEPALGPDRIFLPDEPGVGWSELREDLLRPWQPPA
jgi:o-succinylbenzoate synthase